MRHKPLKQGLSSAMLKFLADSARCLEMLFLAGVMQRRNAFNALEEPNPGLRHGPDSELHIMQRLTT